MLPHRWGCNMSQLMRFGRKVGLPSTLQIRRELIGMIREEERMKILKASKAETLPALGTHEVHVMSA